MQRLYQVKIGRIEPQDTLYYVKNVRCYCLFARKAALPEQPLLVL